MDAASSRAKSLVDGAELDDEEMQSKRGDINRLLSKNK